MLTYQWTPHYSHVLQCETALWLQQLGASVYSHLPDIVSTVWIEQAILFEKIFYLCRREIKYISIIIDLYLYTIGFACKYASYCATSKILFGWLQFRWDYKHHHIISRVVLGFSSFTVLSLGSITSAHVAFTRTTCSFSLLCSQPFLPFGCFLRGICTFFSTEVLSVRVPGGCRSNGWHGYCPGSLVAPFRITRQYLPHGFNLIFIEGIKKRAFLPKATKKSA